MQPPYPPGPPSQQYPQGYPPPGYPPPGYQPPPPPKKEPKWVVFVAVAVGIGALISCATCSQAGKKAQEEKAAKEKAGAEDVALEELLSTYRKNEVKADARWKGKVIKVSGKVESVGKDILDKVYVTLGDGEFRQAQCFFTEKNAKAVADIDKGQTVTVRGRVKGLMMNVLLEDCELVP